MSLSAPSQRPGLEEHFADAPQIFKIFWVVASSSVFITSIIALRHIFKVQITAWKSAAENGKVFVTSLAAMYRILSCLPLVMVWTSWAILTFPESYLVFHLVDFLFRIVAIRTFWYACLELVGGAEALLQAMQTQPAKRWFCVPPLCCVFGPLVGSHTLRERDLHIANGLILQYCSVGLVIELFTSLHKSVELWMIIVRIISTISCVSGVRALESLMRGEVESRGFVGATKFKSITLAVVAPQIVQIFPFIPGVVQDFHAPYSKPVMQEAWVSFLLCCVCPLIGFLVSRGWPASELELPANSKMQSQSESELNASPHIESPSALASQLRQPDLEMGGTSLAMQPAAPTFVNCQEQAAQCPSTIPLPEASTLVIVSSSANSRQNSVASGQA